MRVIARATLAGFLDYCATRSSREVLRGHLNAWYAVVSKAKWLNSAQLKQQIGSASIISAKRVVFNIKGNDFRLVAEVSYEHQILFIKWLGTHKEYDKIDVLTIEYDKERYANPSDSK
jgi:mRNA interferase HigB